MNVTPGVFIVGSVVTGVGNIGNILSAMTAATLAGRYAPVWKVPARSLTAAAVGGLMLAEGARLASSCHIGARLPASCQAASMSGSTFVAAFAGKMPGACGPSLAWKPKGIRKVAGHSYKCGPFVTGVAATCYTFDAPP